MTNFISFTPHHILLGLMRIRWVGHEACMRNMRDAYKIFVAKSKGKRPLGGPLTGKY